MYQIYNLKKSKLNSNRKPLKLKNQMEKEGQSHTKIKIKEWVSIYNVIFTFQLKLII